MIFSLFYGLLISKNNNPFLDFEFNVFLGITLEDLNEYNLFEETLTEQKWQNIKLILKNLTNKSYNIIAPLMSSSNSKY